MRIIEILSENDAANWSTVKDYRPDMMPGEFSDSASARKFFRGKFIQETKKLIGFLDAWEAVAKEHGYVRRHAVAAKLFAEKLVSAAQNDPTTEALVQDLPNENRRYVKDKFEHIALVFGSLSRAFEEVDEQTLSAASKELNRLLDGASAEVETDPIPKANVA